MYEKITLAELKKGLDKLDIKYNPNSVAEVEAAKAKFGGIPKLLEQYFLEIGYFSEISNSGMGCHIDDLSDLYIETAEEIKEEYEDCENEVDDYLIFARESVSVDEVVIKVKDFHIEDPPLFSHYDLEEVNEDNGLLCAPYSDLTTLSSFFSLVLESAEQAQ